jgi:hypothetical protein
MILTRIQTTFVFICDDCGAVHEHVEAGFPSVDPPPGHHGYRRMWQMVGRPPRVLCPECVTIAHRAPR